MDKTVAGLLGAVGAMVASTPGQAMMQPAPTASVLEAASYSDLLRPIPNALETLQAMDGASAPDGAYVEQVQLDRVVRDLTGHHHHHHHHRYYRRRYHHHHHHHHQGYYR